MITDIESARSWSMITDTPVFVYVRQHDAHVCYWNGIPMTRKHAQRIICENWLKLYQAKHVYEEIYAEYSRLRSVSTLPFSSNEHYDYTSVGAMLWLSITNQTTHAPDFDLMEPLVKKYSSQTALQWLLQDAELVL